MAGGIQRAVKRYEGIASYASADRFVFLIRRAGETAALQVQLRFINARLAYLEDASKRLGRKDWMTIAVGIVTNIVVGAAFAPDTARELFRMAGQLFGWISSASPLLN
jgi:hypothetical protein